MEKFELNHASPELPEDQVARAEAMMSSEQARLSWLREHERDSWNPQIAREEAQREVSRSTNEKVLRHAEDHGERIIEVELHPMRLRLAASTLFGDSQQVINTALYDIRQQLKPEVLETLNREHPELIRDIETYHSHMRHLYKMIQPQTSGPIRTERTHLYDSSEAKHLVDECRSILQKYGKSGLDDASWRYLLEEFASLGDRLE